MINLNIHRLFLPIKCLRSHFFVIFININSLLGGLLIICGLYIVLWGKSQEMKKITQLTPTESIEPQHERIDLVISSPIPLPKIGSDVRDSNNSNYNTH